MWSLLNLLKNYAGVKISSSSPNWVLKMPKNIFESHQTKFGKFQPFQRSKSDSRLGPNLSERCYQSPTFSTRGTFAFSKSPFKNPQFRSTPHPLTVTTRIITFLVGNPYKPSFATVTGWGVDPTHSFGG